MDGGLDAGDGDAAKALVGEPAMAAGAREDAGTLDPATVFAGLAAAPRVLAAEPVCDGDCLARACEAPLPALECPLASLASPSPELWLP